MFQLLTVCVQNVNIFDKHVTSLKQILLFLSNYIHFSCVQGFATELDLDFPTILILFVSFSVSFLSLRCVLYICLVYCPCTLFMYVVLSLYITNWILNLQINNQEIN